jgi:hypothetical protein
MSDSYETKADPPVDPSVTIVNDLLYGDPDESGSKLRSFVQNEAVAAVQGHAFAQRRSAEIAAGHRLVSEFKEREPVRTAVWSKAR